MHIYAEPECRGPKSNPQIRQLPIRVLIDDLTVTAESVPNGRRIFSGLERIMGWAKMSLKPTKSTSLVLKRGGVAHKFSVSGTPMPTISEKPIKSLGKSFDSSLRVSAFIKNTCEGKFRALPRILWPLHLHEFPITTISELERPVSRHLRRPLSCWSSRCSGRSK